LGQTASYLYIQGDKKIPFYVKLNGKMVARYGKDYCIVPNLKGGPAEIEILFQQNIVSPQTYTILVPEHGERGFLMDQQDGKYALYDLQKKTWLYPDGGR
jgi:hypothetical protein